jgi:hypothetical protein
MPNDISAIKKLTRNDVSWISPGSKSHQAGINLPLRSFRSMFISLIQNEEVNAPRQAFQTVWYTSHGELIVESLCQVVRYHSKNELRLVNIPKNNLAQHLEEEHYLFIRRDMDFLHISVLEFDPSHLMKELGTGISL